METGGMRKRLLSGGDTPVWLHSLFLLGFAALAWLLIELRALLVILLFSITLASAIAPVAEWMEARARMPRALCVLAIYAIVSVGYSLVAVALYPTLSEQAQKLYSELPRYASGLTDVYSRAQSLLGEQSGALSVSSEEVKTFMSKLSKEALHFTHDLMTLVVSGVLVLFLTAYFVVEADKLWPRLLRWLPKDKRDKCATIIKPLESRLGGYVRGQLLVSLAVATFLGAGLTVLGVEHSLVLGILAGLLNLVPFVGSLLTAVLAILVAFNQSLLLAALTALLFAIEQWFESNFIVPHLLGGQVELHPLAVLFSILVGATLMGLPGALIAVPLATALTYLAEEFYLRPLEASEMVAVVSGNEQVGINTDMCIDSTENEA